MGGVVWIQCAKCAVFTILLVYPFFAVVNHKNNDSDFQACDKGKHPCIFMQFYSDCQDHLPPTFREDMKGRVAPVDQKNLSKPWFPFPLFVEVENGRKYVHAEAPNLNFWDFVPYTYSFYPATVTHVFVDKHAKIFESPALCKDSSNVAPHHHLEHGTSQLIYIMSLGMWTVLSILHDSALLCGVAETWTLSIGLLTFMVQVCTCAAAFSWAATSVEVFIGPDSHDHHDHINHHLPADHFHCYFMLKQYSMLIVLIVPFGLWQATKTRLANLNLSVAHGDYLYSAVYQVPFRVVRDTLPSNPLDSLLTVNMHGDEGVGCAANPELTFQQFTWLSLGTRIMSGVWFMVQLLFIAPFTIGPLFRRLLMEAVLLSENNPTWTGIFSPSFKHALMYGTYFVAIIVPLLLVIYGFYQMYSYLLLPVISGQLKKRCNAIMLMLCLVVATFILLSAFVSTLSLMSSLSRMRDKEGNVLKENALLAAWAWYFHGVLIFLLVVFQTESFVSWPLWLRSFSQVRYEFLLDSIELKPEWRLELHEKLMKTSRHLVDDVRDALEDDDSEASHIWLAEEIIKSHANWNESSSDSDLWDKITEVSHSGLRSLRLLTDEIEPVEKP